MCYAKAEKPDPPKDPLPAAPGISPFAQNAGQSRETVDEQLLGARLGLSRLRLPVLRESDLLN